MRFKRSKALNDAVPSGEEINPNPYDDEPETWGRLTKEQLVEAWYRADSKGQTAAIPKPLTSKTLLEAAFSGNRQAQYTLGKVFYNGVSEDVNYFQAASWYSRASALGSPFADYELAKMCAFGIGIDKDPDQADLLYKNSYQAFISLENHTQNKSAEVKLSVICQNNLAEGADPVTASYWHRKAQEDPHNIPSPTGTSKIQLSEAAEGIGDQIHEDDKRDESSTPKSDPESVTGLVLDTPAEFQDVIKLLRALNVHPGDACAVLDGDQVLAGTIYRIEIYSNTVLISTEIEDIRRPYPVSSIGKLLFVGKGFLNEAEKILKERNGNDE